MRPEAASIRIWARLIPLLLIPFVLGGCFAMQKDVEPIRSDISVLEKQFVELQREQAMLKNRVDEVRPAEGAASGDLSARLARIEARLDALEKKLNMGGQPAEQPAAPAAIPPETAVSPEPVVVEPMPETEQQPSVVVTPGTAPTTPARASMAAEDIYSEAMTAYNAGDLAGAQQGFTRIVQDYPDNRLADNAAYWIGKIQFDNKEYQKAVETFRNLVSSYPVGDKVPDAVYMMGRSYEEMGQPDKAKDAYKRVMDNYPYSDAARNARQRLNGAN
jgi:tol-pal system protein YbgF